MAVEGGGTKLPSTDTITTLRAAGAFASICSPDRPSEEMMAAGGGAKLPPSERSIGR